MLVYHGTNKEFERFDNGFMDSNELSQELGSGFYFTKKEDIARQYGDVILKCEISDGPYILRYESEEVGEDLVERMIKLSPNVNDALSDFGEVGYEGYATVFSRAVEAYVGYRLDQFVNALSCDFYKNEPVLFNKNFKELTGYVGVVDCFNYLVFLAEDIRIVG